jgi:hypothetical protein
VGIALEDESADEPLAGVAVASTWTGKLTGVSWSCAARSACAGVNVMTDTRGCGNSVIWADGLLLAAEKAGWSELNRIPTVILRIRSGKVKIPMVFLTPCMAEETFPADKLWVVYTSSSLKV